MIEYVDHLHEHFEDPCQVVGGRYLPPKAAGFSIKMREESVQRYLYPLGSEWQRRHVGRD